MKFQTRGAVSWLRKTPEELVHGWTSMASSMSGSSLFQGARQVPDGFWLQRAVHTGWGSGEALSCWVRMVPEARDKNRAAVPPVSLPSSRTETWGKLPGSPARLCARFLARVSWCPVCVGGPGLWPSVPVLCVGLVPSCALGLGALSGFVLRVCFKKRRRPRAPTQRPGFPTLEGDDPRTDLLPSTSFYATWLGGIAGVMGHRMAVLAYRTSPVLSRSPSLIPSFPSSSCRFDKNAARDWASDVVLHRRCWLSLASTFRSKSVCDWFHERQQHHFGPQKKLKLKTPRVRVRIQRCGQILRFCLLLFWVLYGGA